MTFATVRTNVTMFGMFGQNSAIAASHFAAGACSVRGPEGPRSCFPTADLDKCVCSKYSRRARLVRAGLPEPYRVVLHARPSWVKAVRTAIRSSSRISSVCFVRYSKRYFLAPLGVPLMRSPAILRSQFVNRSDLDLPWSLFSDRDQQGLFWPDSDSVEVLAVDIAASVVSPCAITRARWPCRDL